MNYDLCPFCNIINKYYLEKVKALNISIYNTILYASDNFLVIPALGSLIPGYIMIISRNHINSMAYLSDIEMHELLNIINHIRKIIIDKFHITPILFEHGSAPGCFDKAANSIDHAHLHLIPISMTNEATIIKHSLASKIQNLQNLTSFKGKPYFLYVNNQQQHYLSHNVILPSQYMRKWIAKEVGRPNEWDWREFQFIENINITIDVLNDNDRTKNSII